MKKSLKYFLSYYTIRQERSKYNGLIKVIMVFNMPRLIVGGMVQSGGLVRKIWDKGISKLKQENKKVNKALVLGFGCGDCAFRIKKYFPHALITGVEVDEKIIEIAKAYFNLNKLKNLNLVVEDGVKFVSNTKEKYDLVLVDAYLGKKVPKVFKSERFFKNLIKVLNKDGMVVFNHLFFGKEKEKAKKMISDLENYFGKIKLVRVASNLLIFAEK